jgi:hypothetical protein
MCYTHGKMQTDIHAGTRSSWSEWADFLRRHHLETLASWALEALGPLMVISAEMFHAGSPLLRPALSTTKAESLAHLLEDPAEAHAFASYLREEISS